MDNLYKIGFGGGCHWCTEAVFQYLNGVINVEQGWIASNGTNLDLSEAVIVHYDITLVDLKTLVAIHLYTHSCTSAHPMRNKYRSAIYIYNEKQSQKAEEILKELQAEFKLPIITKILPFVSFKLNLEKYQNYYEKNADNQFCETYINPKLSLLMQNFSKHLKTNKQELKT